jgi:chitosanase
MAAWRLALRDPMTSERPQPRSGPVTDSRTDAPTGRLRCRRSRRLGVALLVVILAGAASTLAFVALSRSTGELTDGRLSADQRRVADQMISVFENSTPEIQYGYIENLDDGRGFTAGRAGFCSGCGDMLQVLRLYAQAVPESELSGYAPALAAIAAGSSDDSEDLHGIEQAWRQAAQDPLFHEAQDTVADQLYYEPAVQEARKNGLTTALSVAVVYDTAVQHGVDSGPDGLTALIDRTNSAMGGSPLADGVEESEWLHEFLEARRATLENPDNSATARVWKASVGRVNALEALLEQGNTTLDTPLTINPWGTPHTLG